MNNIINFNPDISANKVKNLWDNVVKNKLEITKELYIAKNYYSAQGFRSDLVPDGTKLNTFEKYLNFIRMPKRTSYNWIERFIPEENKLLTYEEFQEKKQIEIDAKKTEEQKKQEVRIKQIREEEKEFNLNYSNNINIKYESEKQERWQRYKNTKDFINKEKEKINNNIKNENDFDSNQAINELQDYFNKEEQKINQRINFNSKVKDLNLLFDVIDDFVVKLNNSQQLECYQNIIKYCKDKAIFLQQNSIKSESPEVLKKNKELNDYLYAFFSIYYTKDDIQKNIFSGRESKEYWNFLKKFNNINELQIFLEKSKNHWKFKDNIFLPSKFNLNFAEINLINKNNQQSKYNDPKYLEVIE